MKILFLLLIFTTMVFGAELPYPVIFIHGIDSDDQTWDEFLDGTLRPALGNPDVPVFHVLANSNLNSTRWDGPDGNLPSGDDDIVIEYPGPFGWVPDAPLYKINFKNWRLPGDFPYLLDHYANGNNPLFNSAGNESAIWKEGIALDSVIKHVLLATGRDKVILVGHSAGGLVAREYLQRTDAEGHHIRWVYPNEQDGHRVAKLVTIGTPHLGSNFAEWPWRVAPDSSNENGQTGARVSNLNSEMIRDLRYQYNEDTRGLYLFGGNEADIESQWFHNHDVDCNGSETDNIIGISDWNTQRDNPNMPLPSDADYLWITSDDEMCITGDCIVDLQRQYLHDNRDTLLTNRTHITETSDAVTLIRGLDQNKADDPWEVSANTDIAGWITYRSNMAGTDEDRYLFQVTRPSILELELKDAQDIGIHVVVTRVGGQVIYEGDKVANVNLQVELGDVSEGQLTILLTGQATSSSWQHPYALRINQTFDTIPPDLVTTLQCSNPTQHSIELNWTASGDDGMTGSGLHTMRWFEQPPSEFNFDQGHPILVNQPYTGGTTQHNSVQLPYANTFYYFAIKVCDEADNCTGLSNICQAQTLPFPVLPVPQIVYVEYFFDNDPGPGNGNGTQVQYASEVTFTSQLDISSLSPGFHRFFLRYLTSQNVWSAAEGRAFYVTPPASVDGSLITVAEMFYDADPGVGSALSLGVTPGSEVTLTTNQDIQSLSPGFHRLYLRFHSSNNLWSAAEGRAFYITPPLTLDSSLLTNAEYFVDTDPGVGQGSTIDVTDSVEAALTQAISPFTETPGFHRFYLRFKTNHDVWSAAEGRALYVTPPVPPQDSVQLASAEYFVDTDPGIGQGSAIDFADTTQIALTHGIDPFTADPGFHRFYLRYRTNHDLWSAAEGRALYVTPPVSGDTATLAAGETFIDTVGNFGSGYALIADDGSFDESEEAMHKNLPVAALAEGLHYVYARVQDSRGLWSSTAVDSFIVGIPAEIKLVILPEDTANIRLTWTSFPNASEYQVHYDSVLTGEYSEYFSVQAPDTSVSVQTLLGQGKRFYHVVAIMPARAAGMRGGSRITSDELRKDSSIEKQSVRTKIVSPDAPHDSVQFQKSVPSNSQLGGSHK